MQHELRLAVDGEMKWSSEGERQSYVVSSVSTVDYWYGGDSAQRSFVRARCVNPWSMGHFYGHTQMGVIRRCSLSALRLVFTPQGLGRAKRK